MKKFLFAALLVLSLAACKKKADTGTYGKTLTDQLVGLGFKDAKVSCPSDVDMKEGNMFTCTVKIDGADYKWKAKITKVDKENHAELQADFDGDAPEGWPGNGGAPE